MLSHIDVWLNEVVGRSYTDGSLSRETVNSYPSGKSFSLAG
jgi:hypothetical protein